MYFLQYTRYSPPRLSILLLCIFFCELIADHGFSHIVNPSIHSFIHRLFSRFPLSPPALRIPIQYHFFILLLLILFQYPKHFNRLSSITSSILLIIMNFIGTLCVQVFNSISIYPPYKNHIYQFNGITVLFPT